MATTPQNIINLEADLDSNKSEKMSIMSDYFENNRKSSVFQDNASKTGTTTAVCSAIRTYIALMDIKNLDSLAAWLTNDLDPVYELEILKMISRRLIANSVKVQHSNLSYRVQELFILYSDEKLFDKYMFSSIAVKACEVSFLLSGKQEYYLERLPKWARDIVCRHLKGKIKCN